MKFTIPFIAALLLLGCKETKQTSDIGPEKTVEMPQEIQTSFLDHVSEYGLLSLEATDESLIQIVEKLKIYDSMIYVLDGRANKNLYVFDMGGKFVRKISQKGRVPQEHIDLHNFEIDPLRKELLLLDGAGRKILIYDLDGEYRNVVKLPSAPECVGRLPNGNFVLAHAGSQLKMNDNYVVAICDSVGNVLSRHIENDIPISVHMSSKDMLVALPDGTMSLLPQFNNVVYHINDNEITPTLGIHFTDKTILFSDFKKEFGDTMEYLSFLNGKNYIAGDHTANDSYLFFSNKGMLEMEHIFVNETSGEILRSKNTLWGVSLTMDQNECFWSNLDEGRIMFSKESNELMEDVKRRMEKTGNPVLIYYKLKI